MARRWRTAGRVAAIGVLAFLLSACLKLDVDLQVNADNTVVASTGIDPADGDVSA